MIIDISKKMIAVALVSSISVGVVSGIVIEKYRQSKVTIGERIFEFAQSKEKDFKISTHDICVYDENASPFDDGLITQQNKIEFTVYGYKNSESFKATYLSNVGNEVKTDIACNH